MTPSIFWYDFETTGVDPRRDRPLQVAGLRTDEALNIIGEPINLYCRPADDILPHPAACLVTGIHPRTLQEQGMDEAEFMTRLHAELARPAPAPPATTRYASTTSSPATGCTATSSTRTLGNGRAATAAGT